MNNKTPKRLTKTKRMGTIGFLIVFGFGLFAFGWLGGSGQISLTRNKLTSQNLAMPDDLNYASVEQVYDSLKKNYDGELDSDELLDGLKAGLVKAAGDDYTEFMNVEQAKEFNSQLNGSLDGIGAELDKKGDSIVIVAPIKGFPAERAGLKAGDVIAEIDGQSASGMTITEAVKKIRGKAGSNVMLTIIRDNSSQKFEITRESITIPSVEHEMLANKTGYISISRFSDDTSKLAREAATDLKSQGAVRVILDLRGNPGGLLQSSVDVSSLWLAEDQVVLEERRGGETIQTLKASGDSVLQGIPTVVLVDEGSASASEIVAGALADNKAATLMGAKTFGKGSVQDIVPLTTGGVLKVTIARWYTPGGHNIDKEGITPSELVKLDANKIKKDIDTQKDAALEFLKSR